MAFQTEFHSAPAAPLWRFLARVGSYFAALGNAILSAPAAEARVRRMEQLNAKTDAELAEMGLRREDIARHVFRDILYL